MIPQDEYEICYWLRNLAAHKHNDVRVALEAADEIERLRAELAELRGACAEKQRCIDSSVDAQRTFLAEIDSLRHDIERHIAIASDLATENERLRAENSAAWDAAEYSARRARLAEAAIEKLREYAEHDAECRGQPGYDIPCSCGYDELMKDLEESK